MTLTYTFKGAEIGGDSVLSKPEITVTAPVKDAEPKDAQTDGFGYAATSKWTNKDGNSVTKFEAGQNYTLTIALTAEEIYLMKLVFRRKSRLERKKLL